jgi:hypothetical protein
MGPPPPPPPPGGGPPGAPPPPGKAKKPNPKPPKPVKPLYWQKVPDVQADRTLWKEIDDSKVEFDQEGLLELFAQAAPAPAPTGGDDGKPVVEKPKIVEILDSNRSKAISIMASRLRRPLEQVAEEIRRCDEKITEDEAQALKTNCPTAEEIGAVMAYEGDPALLGKAEQFVVAVAGVKLLPLHLSYIQLARTFESQMEDVEKPLTIIQAGLDALKKSKKLPELLALLLRIGNFLNGGTARGGAYGFKFEFLDKFREIRTQRPGYLLVNFIAETFPVDELVEELTPLKKMTTVDLETGRKGFKAIEATFKELEGKMGEAEALTLDAKSPSQLYPQFQQFKAAQSERISKPEAAFKEIDVAYAALVKSWGEDPDQSPMAEFIGTFIKVVDDLKKSKETNEKKKADAAKAAAKAAAGPAHSARAAGPAGPQLGAGDAQRGVLDELMKNLSVGPVQLKKVGPRGAGPAPAMPDLSQGFPKLKKVGGG